MAAQSWGLVHQAGVFTYPHQDADGEAAYVLGIYGLKMWTFYFVRDHTKTRDEILEIVDNLITTDKTDHPNFDTETIYIYPGDLV